MSMYLISSTGTLSGSSGQIFFSNIPQTFTHLQLRVFGRIDVSANQSATSGLQINQDGTAGNYDGHAMLGNGSSITCTRQGFYNAWFTQPYLSANNSLANVFGCQLIDLLDYTNTSKFKTIRAIGGFDDTSANGSIGLYSGLWRSTAAINSLTINVSGNLFRQYSRVDLYGITNNPIATGA